MLNGSIYLCLLFAHTAFLALLGRSITGYIVVKHEWTFSQHNTPGNKKLIEEICDKTMSAFCRSKGIFHSLLIQ